jgi:rubrerythrin
MFWERIDDLEALRIAIQAEIDAHTYYRDAMKFFSEKETKDLLATLANEELRHRKKLEDQYSNVSGKRLLYINLPKKRRFTKPLMPDATELEVLETAIEHERGAMEFYEKAAQRTMDAHGKAVFLELMEEEDKHYNLLQAEFGVREKMAKV